MKPVKKQARAPKTIPFGPEAFAPLESTEVRWLGNAGMLLNSRGTCLMVDPLLEGFDLPLLADPPITSREVPRLDAVLITHSDNDHYSLPTCRGLAPACGEYHGTGYTAELMSREALPAVGHGIGESFRVGDIRVTLTPADHTWQADAGIHDRIYRPEDCCGFWMETPDGAFWAPGDSRLMDAHLHMPSPDAILFDFSDDSWHIGLENAIRLGNTYPRAALLLSHWGSVDAPDMKPFNADPADLDGRLENPGRIHILAPGEPFPLRRTSFPPVME